MIPVTELRNGIVFEDSNIGKEPYVVVRYEHIKMARGGAVVKLKLKGLLTGVVKEASFKSNDKVQEADVVKRIMQYLYGSETLASFMDPKTYEQVDMDIEIIGAENLKFLKGGEELFLTFYQDRPISMELPKTVTLKVEYTEPGFKGDSATSILKPAIMETGLEALVPLFVKTGDVIKIKTENKEYGGKT